MRFAAAIPIVLGVTGVMAAVGARADRSQSQDQQPVFRADVELIRIDVSVFEQIVDAFAAGDRRLEEFYLDRARAEFEPALEAWIAQARDDIEGAPSTPFALPEYELAAAQESEDLQHQAEGRFQDALDDNQRSDNYVLLAVLFASVLLFAGLAPKSRSYPIQAAMITLAVVVLMVGIGFLIAFPKTF